MKLGSDIYRSRRKQLASRIDGGLLVLTAYGLMQQSADMSQPFIQEANFLYVSGITEPNWKLIYDGTRDRCWLVRPKKTEVEVLFGGNITDEQMLDVSGADEVVEESQFDNLLRQMRRQHSTVHTLKPPAEDYNFTLNPLLRRLVAQLERIFASTNDIARDMADMRAIKQLEEVKLIKRAIDITKGAFSAVQDNIGSYSYEHEVEAEFWKQFRSNEATHAYSPIIASGGNATILHYEKNNDRLIRRKPLLIDCGASYAGYNADITRTLAVGDPTKEQVRMYSALLHAHQQIIGFISPGLSFREYQSNVDKTMKATLQDLGMLKEFSDETTYRKYFPHAISHGIGLDVHESLGSSDYFKPGMVLTVEPGIYDQKKQLGMRVEDNILVTETGFENLSKRIDLGLPIA